MTYNLLNYLNTHRDLIINQFRAAYLAQITDSTLLEILGIWYTTSEVTNNNVSNIINFTSWTRSTNATPYYTQSSIEYNITLGDFTSSAFEGTISYGTGTSSTTSGISPEHLALLTLYYPVSHICFLKGSFVETDQGNYSIETLQPGIHTIQQNRIVAITRTTGEPHCLVKIIKDSISDNVPNKDTILTRCHKVRHENRMREAFRIPGTIRDISYNGETLYNVLLDHHGIMKVNNMVVETLHPENKVTKLITF